MRYCPQTNALRLVAVLAIWLAGALAQGQSSAIEGNVLDPSGKALANIQVRIVRKDARGAYQVKTDKLGHYLYTGLPLGTYDIYAVETGGSAKISEVHTVQTRTGNTAEVALTITGAGGDSPVPIQPPPSGMVAPTELRGVTPRSSGPLPGAKYYVALVIGNNRYESLPHLNTAANDAQAIGRLLKSDFGFQTELITDGTREQIFAALNRYRRDLSADTSFVLYYAGHGYFDKDAGRAYWLPVDARPDENTKWISSDDITADLRATRANHILVIADSCYSGALSRDAPIRLGSSANRAQYLDNLSQRGPSRILLASGGNEPVSDGGGADHSVFADSLLNGLMKMQFERFSVDELFTAFIQESVAGRSGQVPECSPLRDSGHDSGSFVFERRPAHQ